MYDAHFYLKKVTLNNMNATHKGDLFMKLIEVKRLQLIHKILSANKLVYNKKVGNYDRKKQEGGHVNITIPIRAYNSTSSHSRLVWSKIFSQG